MQKNLISHDLIRNLLLNECLQNPTSWPFNEKVSKTDTYYRNDQVSSSGCEARDYRVHSQYPIICHRYKLLYLEDDIEVFFLPIKETVPRILIRKTVWDNISELEVDLLEMNDRRHPAPYKRLYIDQYFREQPWGQSYEIFWSNIEQHLRYKIIKRKHLRYENQSLTDGIVRIFLQFLENRLRYNNEKMSDK